MMNFAHAWRSGWSYGVDCSGKGRIAVAPANVLTPTMESSGTEDTSKVSRIWTLITIGLSDNSMIEPRNFSFAK